ncbi:uncharacterized protein C8Q71DRAFT_228924 [Rhodofomes roseus]|uniref:Arrestin-like N-terminal domain-containing protein n=1 Tax=Rhodofomes roseus TaxID=34475 RepID=A0ABQ8KV40_9APHY|nr:uncharacterized protein C8Q71DRAFT_228924 [Rhodofomes roseus]KAH9842947.1 hypothetical protein C8Q71DRAFT_228924 [Rhodofomes roseus]
MVTLSIATARGAPCSSRYFPHSGYLGLTPVRVEVVRTKLDEDRRPLPAKAISISVRCYEARVSRSRGTVHTTLLVDHTNVLWSKSSSADWGDVGELELPFKVTLPKSTAGLSTANFQVYRTFWRVEATIDHIPITGVGHRLLRYFDLALIRYDVPSHVLSTPYASSASPYLYTSKPRAPVVRYNVSTPDHPIGPNDIIFASVTVQPLDPGVSVRSAVLTIERRIDLLSLPTSSPPPTPTVSPYHADDIPTPSSSTSTLSPALHDHECAVPASSSQFTLESVSSSRPLLSPASASPHAPSSAGSASHYGDPPARTITSNVLTAEYTDFARDRLGTFSKTSTLQWPTSRPHSRWALGETMHTSRAAVRFFVRASLRVVGPGGSDMLELEPREIAIAATSEAERRLALAKYAEQREATSSGRSKSKSPWRSRHDPDEERVQAELAVQGQAKTYPGAVPDMREPERHRHHCKEKGASRGTKRPHTSAGPRDKSNFAMFSTRDDRNAHVDSTSSGESRDHRQVRSHGHERKSSRGYDAVKQESGLGESALFFGRQERERERERTANTKERHTPPQPDHVRAWEEELARIEAKSRRNSSMLNLWGLGRKKEIVQRG